jgi:hypothetical protein
VTLPRAWRTSRPGQSELSQFVSETRAQIIKSDIAIAVSASEQTKLEDQRASLDLEALPAESSPTGSRKRNASIAGLDDDSLNVESPDNDQLGDDASGKKRPIKRACNECRQQKVSTPQHSGRHSCCCRAVVLSHCLR